MLKNELKDLSKSDKAEFLPKFFKTGKGEYAEGDKFLGITVPEQRKVAVQYSNSELKDILELLKSEWHEERLTALLILTIKFKKAKKNPELRHQIYTLYLENTEYINNWDLVDSSAPIIVGGYLLDKPRDILYKLAKSTNLWEKRIAILSTLAFIKNKEFKDTFLISEVLLADKHDLIHKAVGWMLREVGKSSGQEVEEQFLKKHYKVMPRTMLRYSIEHFNEDKKRFYMSK